MFHHRNRDKLFLCPLRPTDRTEGFPLCGICGPLNEVQEPPPPDDGWESINEAHIEPAAWDVHDGGAELDDSINVDSDEVVQKVEAMPAPIQPTKSQTEAHNLTHWPYRSWCPHCVAARRPNSQHRRVTSEPRREFHSLSPTTLWSAITRTRNLPSYLS